MNVPAGLLQKDRFYTTKILLKKPRITIITHMNILGIIAEFNPLHTGHEYLMQNLRRETGAEFCVAVMSGDYVQRGEPAFFSKFLRTRAALSCGADLVLELPLSVSTGSAEYFAQGAVSLLSRLNCVTHLGFGSESGDIHALEVAGKLLSKEPETYRNLLQKFLKTGMNFPKARYEALSAFLTVQASQNSGSADDCFLSPDILSLLNGPNNILGTEYMKALYSLNSSITPVTIKRIGAGYHEEIDLYGGKSISAAEKSSPKSDPTDSTYASASGLRKAFLSSPDSEETNILLENYVPKACHSLFLNALHQRQYVTFDDFFLPLYHTLQYADTDMLSCYQDVTPEFSGRLLHVFRQCSSVTGLHVALKTKNLTSTRINRALLHILLHLTKDTVAAQKEQGYALYARILGFRKEAKPLLAQIKQHASIPLVSKLADAPGYLSPSALSQLEQTIKASELYRAALPGAKSGSEYSQNIIVL